MAVIDDRRQLERGLGLARRRNHIVNAVRTRFDAEVVVVLRLVLHHRMAGADDHAALQWQPVFAKFALVNGAAPTAFEPTQRFDRER